MAQRRWEDKLQGWRDGPTGNSHHAAPTSLLPPLACLSGSQTLLSVFFFLSKDSSLAARRLKFGNEEVACRLRLETLAWKGAHGWGSCSLWQSWPRGSRLNGPRDVVDTMLGSPVMLSPFLETQEAMPL